jgi:HNH endonuclease
MTPWPEAPPADLERFASMVRFSTKCWEWTGARDRGYGAFWLNGRRQRAHRVSYEWAHGPVPEGFVLDHLCNNKACVNPAHVAVNWAYENLSRRSAPPGHCRNGHPYDLLNTGWSRGWRFCRACAVERQRRRVEGLGNPGCRVDSARVKGKARAAPKASRVPEFDGAGGEHVRVGSSRIRGSRQTHEAAPRPALVGPFQLLGMVGVLLVCLGGWYVFFVAVKAFLDGTP